MRERAAKRVLMTADCVGGVWTYSLELTKALQKLDVETLLLVTGGELSASQAADARSISNLHVVNRPLKVEWMPDPEHDILETNTLLLQLEQLFDPDIVHINGYANAAAGFRRPVVSVAHSCVPSWWAACRGGTPSPEWDGYRRRLRAGLSCANALVAPTFSYLKSLEALHGSHTTACVIYNGRDQDSFIPGAKKPFALAAGRFWDEAKNLQVVVSAKDQFEHDVFVAGDAAGSEAPGGHLSLLGPLSAQALGREMSQAAVFIAPARYEPFGLAILEAGLSGCALVLGDIDTLRELWDGAARFVDPDDAETLAAHVNRLLADPGLAKAEGAKARTRARRYSASGMGAAYFNLYNSLLTPRRKQPHQRSAGLVMQ